MNDIWLIYPTYLNIYLAFLTHLSSKSIVTPSDFTSSSHLILFPAKSKTIFYPLIFFKIARA
jgi:hypothetical protein